MTDSAGKDRPGFPGSMEEEQEADILQMLELLPEKNPMQAYALVMKFRTLLQDWTPFMELQARS